MATLLGGSRWDDEMTPLDDDWAEEENNPLDDDYVREEYRSEEE